MNLNFRRKVFIVASRIRGFLANNYIEQAKVLVRGETSLLHNRKGVVRCLQRELENWINFREK